MWNLILENFILRKVLENLSDLGIKVGEPRDKDTNSKLELSCQYSDGSQIITAGEYLSFWQL